jgi:hypothetical protein
MGRMMFLPVFVLATFFGHWPNLELESGQKKKDEKSQFEFILLSLGP